MEILYLPWQPNSPGAERWHREEWHLLFRKVCGLDQPVPLSRLWIWFVSKSWPVSPEERTRATQEEAMEANIQLMRVIQEMRAEINKLEKENQALRMKLASSSQRAPGSGGESGDEREEEVTDLDNLRKAPGQPPAVLLHGGISTDSAPAMQEHQGTQRP